MKAYYAKAPMKFRLRNVRMTSPEPDEVIVRVKACGVCGWDVLVAQTVAEDFSEYGAVTPAVFVFLGNWPEEVDPATQPTNHSPYFHMHEPYMERGVKAYGHMVVDFLNSQRSAEK